ncbi:acetyl-CoA hydrolase/transferase C-terminal domain-containing protein, partial [Lysobacter sp. D1-1-M9]|uniref:acetyl-CoA hydrolase/transferase C-terminal domain-containing protein n=1 Tax=Novilysobacter longmucuonensis TaxID=3098603 RepID=UPI002FCC9D62
GQYNFVAMAHALPGARSVLMLRATRESAGHTTSNILWNYGHSTIPRHLRDVYITEYGVADLRGKRDADCVTEMLRICEARFQQPLLEQAKTAGKVPQGESLVATMASNTPQRLREALAPLRRAGTLPDYPLGSDFTPDEERLVTALAWLQSATAGRSGKLKTVLRALVYRGGAPSELLARMDLQQQKGLAEWLQARLLALALREAPE